jgi:hypothetical protein
MRDLAELLRRRAAAVPVAILAVVVTLLFWPIVFQGRVLYARDLHAFLYPELESFARAVAGGSWPLWDPAPSFGQPMFAAETAVFYPWTWLDLVLRPWTWYSATVVAHLVFTGAGMYALGLRLGVSRAAATLSGAAWTSCGPLLSLVGMHHFPGAAWLPWVVLAADLALRTGRLRHALLWGGAVGAQVLAGSADMCAIGLVLTAVWAAPIVVARARGGVRGEVRGAARSAAVCAAAAACALAVSAPQWLALLHAVRASARGSGLGAFMRTYWSVPPLLLAQLALPVHPHLLPLQASWRTALAPEGRDPFLWSLYLGLPCLAFVAAAFVPRHGGRRWWLLAVAVGAALVALGGHAPLYAVATTLLPPLKLFRYPAKALLVSAFVAALLAGAGFEAWSSSGERRRFRGIVIAPLAIVVVIAAGAFAVTGPLAASVGPRWLDPAPYAFVLAPTARHVGLAALFGAGTLLIALGARERRLAVAAAVLAVADLVAVHRDLHPTTGRELFSYRPPTVDAAAPPDASRLYVYNYWDLLGPDGRPLRTPPVSPRAPRVDAGPLGPALLFRTGLVPPQGAWWGIPSSYDVDPRGLFPANLSRLTHVLRAAEGTRLHDRLLQMGAVSRVLALHTAGLEGLVPLSRVDALPPYAFHVFAVPEPLPRAYAVGAARVADGEAAWAALLAPDFDIRREVLLPRGRPRAPGSFNGSVRIADLKADRVRLEAETDGDGWVVLVDTWAPGWEATVDGQAVEILPANLAFRAVPVPAGRHTIEETYRPRSVLLGVAVSLAALAAGAIALARGRGGTASPLSGGSAAPP